MNVGTNRQFSSSNDPAVVLNIVQFRSLRVASADTAVYGSTWLVDSGGFVWTDIFA